jgi:catechol 2,3-dioxygenase-like lactoylglutathione lyase family enzyme
VNFSLEVVMLPVSDVDRSMRFYTEQLGFRLDTDHRAGDQFRVVQVTPPGSACSVVFGTGVHGGAPGTVLGTHLVVTDIAAARELLVGRGVEVSEIRHMTPSGWQPGVDPQGADYNSFADFADPDGNTWEIQERRSPAPPPP